MVEEIEKLVRRHPCVRQGRAIGLFGGLDLIGKDGNFIQELHQGQSPKTQAFRQAMLDNGLWGLFRPPLLHCAPPLIITEAELREGYRRLSLALEKLDAALP